jgi:hypothetical protein
MYLATVACDDSNPSFNSSPWPSAALESRRIDSYGYGSHDSGAAGDRHCSTSELFAFVSQQLLATQTELLIGTTRSGRDRNESIIESSYGIVGRRWQQFKTRQNRVTTSSAQARAHFISHQDSGRWHPVLRKNCVRVRSLTDPRYKATAVRGKLGEVGGSSLVSLGYAVVSAGTI